MSQAGKSNCVVPTSPPQKGLEIPRGMGGAPSKAKKFKGKYETKVKFLEGWRGGGGLAKIPSMGEVLDIFWTHNKGQFSIKIIASKTLSTCLKQ